MSTWNGVHSSNTRIKSAPISRWILIDFSGAIKRHGRKFEYPVRVVSQGEHEAGLRGLIGKTRDELKYARS